MAAKKRVTKKVTMTTPKPVLRCETETIHKVEYHELDSFIQAVTGHYFECVPNEEWGNDSQHRFDVDGDLSEYDQKEWDKFKKTGEQQLFGLRTVLDGLVKDGHLTAGVYLITVCW